MSDEFIPANKRGHAIAHIRRGEELAGASLAQVRACWADFQPDRSGEIAHLEMHIAKLKLACEFMERGCKALLLEVVK